MFVNTRRGRISALAQCSCSDARSVVRAMLVLLLLVNAVFGRDTPKTTNFIVKPVESCPDVGYFFQRELATNSLVPGHCYLCFCQHDGTATCWLRENRRCDLESYHHHGVGKRDTRVRRGLGDIFFRDAARDIFNKRLPEQCKPFESSFSDGCPPVDWCIGCTVCDCDAHGRWDCHVLSFCPESTTKKKAKKRRGPYKRTVIRKSPTTLYTKRTTNVTRKSKPTQKPKPKPKIIKSIVKKPADKRYKRQPVKQPKQISNVRKVIGRRLRSNKVTKKNITTRKPVHLKNSPTKQIVLPSTPSLNKAVIKQILAAVQKLLRHDLTKGNASRILKVVGRKPLMTHKQATLRNSNSTNVKSKVIVKHNTNKSKASDKRSKEHKKATRNKRHVNIDEIRVVVPTTASTNKANFTNFNTFMEVTSEKLIPSNGAIINVTTPLITVTDSAYYNYVFDSHTTENNTIIKRILTNTYTAEFVLANQSEPKINLTTETPNNITMEKNILDIQENKEWPLRNMISSIESIPNVNDLKFNNWSQVKILKDREKHKNESENVTNAIKIISVYNKTIFDKNLINKNKFYSKDVKRKLGLTKKFKVEKIINPYKKGRDSKLNTDKPNVIRATGSIVDLQNMLKKLLSQYNRNNSAKVKPKVKKFNVIKYLRRFLNKMFRKSTKKSLKNNQDIPFDKRHVIETLCETFGPCKVSPRHKVQLKAKLEDLNTETAKILKTINIIKGLLHLVESPKSNKINNIHLKNNNADFNDDIKKLNAIIKGTYSDLSPDRLSQTQETQIDYIKKNTDEFIQSVGKFANLLNEIVSMLTTKEKESDKFYRVLRSSNEDKNYTQDAFKNLKNLIFKYDLIQNTFMRRMYEALSMFESKLSTKRPNVTMEKELNSSASISNFSRNILTNLRKLTNLAQNLNSRTKREAVRNEDTVEYLLMLMEYLLKQNYPLDAAPVNDGIDLLIEAIKNAPDIKPIKKKVLDFTPAPIIATTSIIAETSNMNDDSLSDSNKISNEITDKIETVTLKLDNAKFIEQVEDDRDDDEKYIYERKAVETSTELNAIMKDIEKGEVVNFEPVTVAVAVQRVNEVDTVDEKKRTSKYEDGDVGLENRRRYEVFNADMDEEIIITSTVTDIVNTITKPTEATTETVKKLKFFNDDSQGESADKKTKLDWIEENYAKEINEFKHSKPENLTKTSNKSIVKQIKTTKKPIEENDSSITKEVKEEKKKKSKIEEDDVMFEKQMDLLNSLDYGTEKTEFDTESKDGNSDDRYSGDAFPTYFI